MTLTGAFKRLLSSSDFFNSSSMLRFEKQNEYKTITGGLVSLAIIIVITIGFTRQILVTLQRTSIQVKSNILKIDIPTSSQVIFSPHLNQMFAFYLGGIEPGNTNISYFDIQSFVYDFEVTEQLGPHMTPRPINLVQCTKQHWEGFDSITFVYPLQSMFCPQIGTTAQIFGKFSNGRLKSINLEIYACDPSHSAIPCANKTELEQFWDRMGGATVFNLFYLNTIITPDQASYKQHYFEERQYGFIGPTLGCDVTLQIADYTVSTDQSIWPFADEVVDNGLYFPKEMSRKYYPRAFDSYSYFSLQMIKSTDKYIFERTVQKISTIFSYIGGVISSLLTAFFVMNNYTSFSFEISIANQIFGQYKASKGQQNQSNKMKSQQMNFDNNKEQAKQHQKDETLKMNIFLYLKFNFYQFFKDKLKKGLQWNDMQHISKCHDQMTKQLDIKRLIKRIIFLEHCITRTIEADKIKDLIITQPTSPEEIKNNRLQLSEGLQQNISSEESEKLEKSQHKQKQKCDQYDFSGEISAQQMVKNERSKIQIIAGNKDDNVLSATSFPFQNNPKNDKNRPISKRNIGDKSINTLQVTRLSKYQNVNQVKTVSQIEKQICEIPIQICQPTQEPRNS